jgi:hypothetical protein
VPGSEVVTPSPNEVNEETVVVGKPEEKRLFERCRLKE